MALLGVGPRPFCGRVAQAAEQTSSGPQGEQAGPGQLLGLLLKVSGEEEGVMGDTRGGWAQSWAGRRTSPPSPPLANGG